jgi:hypothetical protein
VKQCVPGSTLGVTHLEMLLPSWDMSYLPLMAPREASGWAEVKDSGLTLQDSGMTPHLPCYKKAS